MTSRSTLWGLILGLGLMLTAAVAPDSALAQCCTPPPPPVCCTTPTPPPCCVTPTPPTCCTNITIPGVNVNVGANVIVNASASANVSASARGGAGGVVFVGGGGWGGGYAPPSPTGLVALKVEGQRKRIAYQATRTVMKRVVIQAVCIDDREIPHPASQVSPDRDIADAFDGELYRCLAGTRLQATWAQYLDKVDFSGGQTIACQKGDALYHATGGKVECRRQKPARDCNERSLLRRFGAGIKILTMISTETYTAYREEEERVESASTMSLDGGVGGIAY